MNTLNNIHSLGIIHNDVKSNNIMLKNINDLSDIRFIDFGLSNFMGFGTLTNISNNYSAAEVYLAPDTYEADNKFYVSGNRKTYVTDIFSVASTMVHIILHRYGLLREVNNTIYMDGLNISNELKKIAGNDFHDLILNMILSDCKFRYSAKKALKHKYFYNNKSHIGGNNQNLNPTFNIKFLEYSNSDFLYHNYELEYMEEIHNSYLNDKLNVSPLYLASYLYFRNLLLTVATAPNSFSFSYSFIFSRSNLQFLHTHPLYFPLYIQKLLIDRRFPHFLQIRSFNI